MNNIIIPDNIPSRHMTLGLVILDICFLVLIYGLLIYKKKYMSTLFALAGGILYFLVDWGIFYKTLGQRQVHGANPFWFLLWLSLSYGTTNFLFIWLAIKKDKHLIHFTLMILIWWICSPMIAKAIPGQNDIVIWRETGKYHWVMALMLIVGYFGVIIYNLVTKKSQLPIIRMLIIGIVVQFGWEFALMINGIRKLQWGPIVIDSLIETNLGIPYIYLIYKGLSKKWNEDLSKNIIAC
ncbi:hypothetical protein KQ874_01575 [Mycoplasma sp. ES3157-GEN-MYC]|uniref:Uncharacterized protein n=1 Tax=Mycoplasma miroungigenitalium TaxID=754515 RepID=A0A6M4J966_9MOLU|nr:hypothetical protein [Mycoplasma miroungigenitalium]MBU4690378.1 hypothetical protein [Mycoplasma miroungigenitalium]MBU4691645.1 hypothetical protein [Mycoplasma miroungigenitalium]QJR43470.1 hypothetical protein HLA87_01560 [Mycoplasma miroungigenitalium]